MFLRATSESRNTAGGPFASYDIARIVTLVKATVMGSKPCGANSTRQMIATDNAANEALAIPPAI
jgi:hypothetical protein